jgi:hypothetical protein
MAPSFSGQLRRLAVLPNDGIPTGDKINRRFPLRAAWSRARQTKACMTVQQQETRKNPAAVMKRGRKAVPGRVMPPRDRVGLRSVCRFETN